MSKYQKKMDINDAIKYMEDIKKGGRYIDTGAHISFECADAIETLLYAYYNKCEFASETFNRLMELNRLEGKIERIKINIQFVKDKCLPNTIAEEYEQKGLQEALDIIDRVLEEEE